jgi:hypothetical protein
MSDIVIKDFDPTCGYRIFSSSGLMLIGMVEKAAIGVWVFYPNRNMAWGWTMGQLREIADFIETKAGKEHGTNT